MTKWNAIKIMTESAQKVFNGTASPEDHQSVLKWVKDNWGATMNSSCFAAMFMLSFAMWKAENPHLITNGVRRRGRYP